MTHYGPEPLPDRDPTPPDAYEDDDPADSELYLEDEPGDNALPDPCSVAPWTKPIDKREMRRRE